MEISTQEKTLQIVSRYVIITLSISIMTIGVYFFKFPNNFVFGGVTGGAALAAKPTPPPASRFFVLCQYPPAHSGLDIPRQGFCHQHRLGYRRHDGRAGSF